MKNSILNHPPRQPMIIIRQWQLEYCMSRKNPKVAASLISFFEYWHNVKLDIREEKFKKKLHRQMMTQTLCSFIPLNNWWQD